MEGRKWLSPAKKVLVCVVVMVSTIDPTGKPQVFIKTVVHKGKNATRYLENLVASSREEQSRILSACAMIILSQNLPYTVFM